MNAAYKHVMTSIGIGLLVIAPVYLSILLLLKALHSLGQLLHPVIEILPVYLQSKTAFALAVLLIITFIIGTALRTGLGMRARYKLESALFERIPGYAMFRGFTQRLAGESDEETWKPALVETDDSALMPVFIIEELTDGRYTVFVPSVPTPLAGAVFVYERHRVHEVDVPFAHALRVISRWGEGAQDMVAAMKKK
ncbi:MAG: hypothetical protein WBA20_05825 [Ketobacter sp.]|uniref:hypothetical protein n=1 Tax=Ketobacter sp. MCCC 1A13808 TaxID=2602738 RepID=UPI0018DBD060|nr:hypothetical protein [Ketobacter sp. MCCC 1A13808]